jgi:type II secretory pathway pseudopilin PulG
MRGPSRSLRSACSVAGMGDRTCARRDKQISTNGSAEESPILNRICPWRGAAGFTLLEILIVLFIAMLMLGMGIVGFAGRLPAAKLDATAREMSALMRQTRLLAKTSMEKQAFVVDMDARLYGIEGKALRKIPDEVQVRVDDFMSGPQHQGSYRMIFSPFGGVDGGTIEMTAGRRGISLKADPILGVHINRMKQQ